jgi:hypothetical protein
VQVKTQTARDEEHRDEHAESSHLELQQNRRLYMSPRAAARTRGRRGRAA